MSAIVPQQMPRAARNVRAIDRDKHAGQTRGEYVVLQQQIANLARISMKSTETGIIRHFIARPR